MNAAALTVGWIDLMVVTLLVVGIMRGRKRGMSEEVLDLVKWTLIVGCAGFLHEPAGRLLSELSGFGLLYSYLFAYLLIAMIIFSLFVIIKNRVGEKLVGSEVFGRAEYYLGMAAGGCRFLCIFLVGITLLGARHYTPEEIVASEKYQDYNWGSKMFPTVYDLQQAVFDKSFTGRAAQDYINVILIKPTPAAAGGVDKRTAVHAREARIDEILDKK